MKFKKKFNTKFIFTEKYRKKSVDLLWSLITLEIILFFIFWGYNHEKCRSSTWNFRKLREKLFGFISYETKFLYFLAVNSEIIAEVIMKLMHEKIYFLEDFRTNCRPFFCVITITCTCTLEIYVIFSNFSIIQLLNI